MNLPLLKLTKQDLAHFNEAIRKEWLITNGLGGYASGTAVGVNTRKYHGLLVASLHPPGDRTVCLAKLDEEIAGGGDVFRLGAAEFGDVFYPDGFRYLTEFSVSPFPRYVYAAGNVEVAKTVFLLYGKNACASVYHVRNKNSFEVAFKVDPLVTCRHFHLVVDRQSFQPQIVLKLNDAREVQMDFNAPKACVVLRATAGEYHINPNWIDKIFYREEAARGESSFDDCYQPGNFEIPVYPDSASEFAVLAAAGTSSQQCAEILSESGSWTADVLRLFNEEKARQAALLDAFYVLHSAVPADDWLSWILLAANSFIVKGFGDGASVIAGYPWFEAWGRDTFVSLPGLLLLTGHFAEARKVLVGFNKFCTLGLIPNFLSDLSLVPSCNTVDATMWYINAVLQYLKYTGDFAFVQTQLWQSLKEIFENHLIGTSFGIRVEEDGLLTHGPRLTWMDAEVNGKAVTPRAGKAVEIQALWYNALRTAQLLANSFEERELGESYALLADKAKASFAQKFWNKEKNCLFDVLGASGPDASVRPNQVIAASLDFTMLDIHSSGQIIDLAMREFLTPCGLRTLERNDPKYKGTCTGDRWTRDQAYHNGTVWPWLLGPFITAYLKTKGSNDQNRVHTLKKFVEPLFIGQITNAGLGTISEIFDGEWPHTPRGCISQAWSVAEPLRAYVEDVLQVRPRFERQVLSVQA
jgi:predicted glycogen debranching enzyme